MEAACAYNDAFVRVLAKQTDKLLSFFAFKDSVDVSIPHTSALMHALINIFVNAQ